MPETTPTCQRCGRPLEKKDIVWLEWDIRFYGPRFEPVPSEFSQGWFPYGKDCAKTLREKNAQHQ